MRIVHIIVSVCLLFASALSLHRPFGTTKLSTRLNASNRNLFLSGVLASFLLASSSIPAQALDDFDTNAKNQFDYVLNTSEEQNMQRKVKLLQESEKKSSSSTTSTTDGDRYKASLKKEKNKEEAISKKTKAERQRDMCETLGRGC